MTESPDCGGRPQPPTAPLRRGIQEVLLVMLGFTALAVAVTWPLVTVMGSVARVDNADAQFSIWNVAWVARTLVVDPLHVFDANIFFPHRGTLAYSEANLGAGLLAIPVYWATRNPYAAFNFILLCSFVANAAGMYYLARYLTGSRPAATVAAICFGFCPYVFGHLPHVQLLMTAGLPLGLLAFHRLSDAPSPGRGVVLGVTMAAQAYFCAYYSLFLMLLVGYAVLFVAAWRRLWTDRHYWSAVAVAAIVAIAATLPLLLPYIAHQRGTGFERSLADAQMYAATWRTYLASSAFAHRWMLALIGRWGELLFPGFVAAVAGLAGAVAGTMAGGWRRQLSVFYGTVAAIAAWASFGPGGGLYRLMYSTVPAFTFLRAPSRFGLLVVLSLSVLSALALSQLLKKGGRAPLVVAIVTTIAAAEAFVPIRFPRVAPLNPVYPILATAPFGGVIELPVYSRAFAFKRAEYMVSSTAHWKPLVDAYSDYTPPEFTANLETIAEFPSEQSFAALESMCARYAVFHLDAYGKYQDALLERLQQFAPRLRRLYADEQTLLYEIVSDRRGDCRN